MKFTIKTLTLYRDLWYSTERNQNIIETEYLWKYRSGNKNNELDPERELFLLEGQFMGYSLREAPVKATINECAILQGKYLFLQGLITDENADNHSIFLQAAEELYLESLWLERKIANDIVYLRRLREDGNDVFQIFREIENT